MDTAEVKQLVEALKDNAERLGLVWTRRFGTVVDVGDGVSMGVALDNDVNAGLSPVDATQCTSICGPKRLGQRVVVDSVPPLSNYVSGSLSGMILQSTIGTVVTVGATATLVPNTTLSFTLFGGYRWEVDASFDFHMTGASTVQVFGQMYVNGVAQATVASYGFVNVVGDRASVAQFWDGEVDSNGTSTIIFDLRAVKANATGTVLCSNGSNTTMRVKIYQ